MSYRLTVRDQRFRRVRRIAQAIAVTGGVGAATLVGSLANHPSVTASAPTTPVASATLASNAPATTAPATTLATKPAVAPSTKPVAKTPVYTAPKAAPVTTTTVCYTTPSGTMVCK